MRPAKWLWEVPPALGEAALPPDRIRPWYGGADSALPASGVVRPRIHDVFRRRGTAAGRHLYEGGLWQP